MEYWIINVLQAKMKSIHNSKFVNIELFVVPKICLLIANRKVKIAETTCKHLVINLPLTKNSPTIKNLNMDILIGSDFYQMFFNGNVINAN